MTSAAALYTEAIRYGLEIPQDRKANRSFPWAWPRQLRNTLRDARHWQADRAHDILMSDPCWDIWRKNAESDPGPEKMG